MNRNLVAALGIALVLVAGGVVAFVASGDDTTAGQPTAESSPDTGPTAERDAAVAGGTEAVEVLNTLDYTDVEAGLDRWESVATGDLLTELRNNRQRSAEQITLTQSKTVATVLSAALAEFDASSGTARLLAAMKVDVTVNGQQSTKRNRMSLSLTRTADGWQANAVAVV
jgi:Mce-associated membrane protein